MEQSDNKLYVALICVILSLTTFIAFEQVRQNDFVYDDGQYIIDNPHVNRGVTGESILWAFSSSYAFNWHPLTWLSHMLDCELFGLNPSWHHLTNLLFHIANTLLLFGILKRMTGAVWQSGFVAAAFALHPLHVESVAWVAERKDVLSGLFWMLTIAAYIRYAERPGIGRFLTVVLFFCLGLMAKPMLVTLPFVLILLDYWPLQRFQALLSSDSADTGFVGASSIRLIVEKIPLFVLAVVSSVVTYIAQQSAGAVIIVENLPLSTRIANTLVSYISYIGKMVYPNRLAVLYPLLANSLALWQPIVCLLVLAGALAAIFYTARRHRYLAVGWLWYLGTLVPVIGLVQVGSQSMADRYTYLPSIGIFIMVGWGAVELVDKWRYRRIGLGIASGVVLAALLICTRRQVQYWQNNLTLYEHTLAVTRNNCIIHNNYGCCLFKRKRIDQAIMHLDEALRINPRYSEARNNIGKAFLAQGKLGQAIVCFNEVLRSSKGRPDVYYNLGSAYARQGKYELAVQNYEEALYLKPDYNSARVNMAMALVMDCKIEAAIEHCQEVLRINPQDRRARQALRAALAKRDKSGKQKDANEKHLPEVVLPE